MSLAPSAFPCSTLSILQLWYSYFSIRYLSYRGMNYPTSEGYEIEQIKDNITMFLELLYEYFIASYRQSNFRISVGTLSAQFFSLLYR